MTTEREELADRLEHGSDDHQTSMALRREAAAALRAPAVTDEMVEAAIAADGLHHIQGFSYKNRHVIRDVWLPFDQQEIWSIPVDGPDEYQAFQERYRTERMRAILTAALAAKSSPAPKGTPDEQ